jgi:UPF0755 protein
MRITKKLLLAIVAIILFDFIWLWYIYTSPVDYNSNQEVEFSITKGESTQEIANKLHEHGLIRSPVLFRVYTYVGGVSGSLQAGDYLLSTSMRMPEIALRFAGGDFMQRQFRLLEGWSLKNIALELEEQELFLQDDFFHTAGIPGVDYREDGSAPKPKDFSEEFPFLKGKPDYVSLEGYLFPDTYSVAKGDTPEDVIRRALRNFEEQLTPEIVKEIEAQKKTLFEVLTMASIIEKEVRSLKDKKLVSGILWKRLAEGMRLQVDATVVYVREGNYYKVTIDETFTESPYNTYRNDGLPPGPISNPGLESIEAALYPTDSPYWFYSSPSINRTIFSRTFEEHKAAADAYVR